EVYFVWGNKDAFLDAAKDLHAELGGRTDRDWDKVLIMGKQICPDEPMFDENAAGGGDLDVDLHGDGSTELDFAFEDKEVELNLDDEDTGGATGSMTATGLDFELAATGERLGGAEAFGEDDFGAATAGGEDFGATTAAGEEQDDDHQASYVLDESLDIGERTAAGLEAALFSDDDDDDENEAQATDTGFEAEEDAFRLDDALGAEDETGTQAELGADIDALAVTQESPTVERPQAAQDDWSMLSFDSPTVEEPAEAFGQDAPTVETPTVEAAGPDAPTVESPMPHASAMDGYDTPTVETAGPDAPTVETAGPEAPTVETPTIETAFGGTARLELPSSEVSGGGSGEHTEEIDLDDLGLNLDDLGTLTGTLSGDLGELAIEDDGSDTREQPALGAGDDLLSATGVTEVLADDEELEHMNTEVLGEQDATMLAPGYGDDTLGGTEILAERRGDEASGDTSLLKMLDGDAAGSTGSGLDLDLEDLASALDGDTVEQPRSSSFEADIFQGNGGTPIDLDVGMDIVGSDDPTGTEDIGPLDPQTMTEIGTKLDLARAYIDMGDPEGARSILEEVLDEGDSGQRREAQGLIDVLSA
ncbi:MAG: hypothetical protein JXB36_03005, partial [Gammaproteobacteria bacterium]|nr:hypothetical protein [Gammaproteobacteria bacterium]